MQFGVSTIALWHDNNGADLSAQSTLTVFRPQASNASHTAVIVAPGGGYMALTLNLEGRQVADWFAARGITAFVLKYRLGSHHPYPEPLLDGQRAVRLVRSMSNEFHLDPDKIGFVGFSAGGHLAAMVATSSDDGNPQASDSIEHFSDRPNFIVLGYPWLNAMQPNDQGLITYCSVLRTFPDEKCKAWEKLYAPSLHVSATTPTTFIYGTTDDKTVPVSASVDFYLALIKAGVPAEMHLFRDGRHASGLGEGDPALEMWPALLENWLRAQSFL
jgi:acetyl esterase/lipase